EENLSSLIAIFIEARSFMPPFRTTRRHRGLPNSWFQKVLPQSIAEHRLCQFFQHRSDSLQKGWQTGCEAYQLLELRVAPTSNSLLLLNFVWSPQRYIPNTGNFRLVRIKSKLHYGLVPNR